MRGIVVLKEAERLDRRKLHAGEDAARVQAVQEGLEQQRVNEALVERTEHHPKQPERLALQVAAHHLADIHPEDARRWHC